ncbi:MAG: Gfo/Idh/MocA family oxidoreductase [Hyphomicrobiales bacterium]|uniref:Gfo/Idh/MocA family oxidoreductase n=1 Tax=Roseibium polysiphoniae TaxID=2571221 RepID=UPI003298F196
MIKNDYQEQVAVIGGGRWARVIASTLDSLLPSQVKISLCSFSNSTGWSDWIKLQTANSDERFQVVNAASILSDHSIQRCFIARAAREQTKTTCRFLEAGKDVYVEKPFALTTAQAREVCLAATGRDCRTSLVFLYHDGLNSFVKQLQKFTEDTSLEIEWCDATVEVRHGETKTYDASLNVVLDVFFHIWGILRGLAPQASLEVISVDIERGGKCTNMKLKLGQIPVRVKVEREAEIRTRRLVVRQIGEERDMDFSTFPGSARRNGHLLPLQTSPKMPMALQLETVLRCETKSLPSRLSNVHLAKEAVTLAEQIFDEARRQQYAFIGQQIASPRNIQDTSSLHYAIQEIVSDLAANFANLNENGKAVFTAKSAVTGDVVNWLKGRTNNAELATFLSLDPGLSAIRMLLDDKA